MNLKDFHKTDYQGLYISKQSHKTFGNKYVARFQLEKKRYLKVLGYSDKDNLTQEKAYGLLVEYKNKLAIDKLSTNVVQNKQLKNKSNDENTKDDYRLLKDILGSSYKMFDKTFLQEKIQKIYDLEHLKQYQVELIKMQNYLIKTNKKMVILFEGRDASGKGGAIRRITRHMNSSHYRVIALGKPTTTQRNQWFFQKYIEHFPTGGEVVLFDRSWYNRAMVEPIFKFCTKQEHKIFMEDVPNFEKDLVRQGIHLVKLYFSVSKSEQQYRFNKRRNDPLKHWKLSEVDLKAQALWDEFSEHKYKMLKQTSIKSSPWHIIRSDDKHKARLESIKIILNSIDYDNKNKDLDLEIDENINISVQKELSNMRKVKDY